MEPKQNSSPSPSLGLDDIYFILFRHKWKILLFALTGILAAVVIFFRETRTYKSEAKLLVRYIVDSKSVTPAEGNAPTQSPDAGGENIINSEIEILTSFDLALEVADAIGAQKILAKGSKDTSRYNAATLILKNLTVDVPRRSNIIKVALRHSDPILVRLLLGELIDAYLKKHLEVHRSVGIFDEFLSQQTDQLRSRISQTEDQLRKVKEKAGVISFEDATRSMSTEMSRIREELLNTEAQLAQSKAGVAELEKLVPARSDTEAAKFGAPLEKINEYKSNNARLEGLLRKLQELQKEFTEDNSMVQGIRKHVAEAEIRKANLEKEYPKLSSLALAAPVDATQPPLDPRLERTKVAVLEAKMKILSSQLEKIRTEATGVDEAAHTVAQLERKKQLDDSNYRYYSASLEKSRIDETLGVARMSNINKVQAPSPPLRDISRIRKFMLIALAGGFLGGIGLAFLLELVIDQTVKRPNEIETAMRLPLYLTVPDSNTGSVANPRLSWSSSLKRLNPFTRLTVTPKTLSAAANAEPDQTEFESSKLHQSLRPFYEALRDRVVMFFEQNRITRKPKLIGVTSCANGSGVTTIASGLAASLSNTGDGKVLLIDLNLQHGGIHPFFEGTSVCGLLDILDNTHPSSARVQEKLDLVSASGANGSAVSVRSKQFTDLIPRLKASDYDYIVFDLPPVNQTSATLRLAGFMDQILLVIEAGKTNRSVVKRSLSFLASSNPSVAGILNKAPCVVPAWLNPEAGS